jgi:CubicO group peptidase (beta-lactamase class C family)
MTEANRRLASLLVWILAISTYVSFAYATARANPGRRPSSDNQQKMSARFEAYSTGAAAASPSGPDVSRMEEVIRSFVSDQRFMGSVLVAHGKEILLDKGYGFANLEWNIPNSPSSKFRLGSITKQFTAASILLLQERGKLSLSDPVKKYLPDSPPAWDKISIFNLLTHTSGIPSFTNFPDYASLEPFATTAEQLVKRFRDKPLDFQPGEKWSYSSVRLKLEQIELLTEIQVFGFIGKVQRTL